MPKTAKTDPAEPDTAPAAAHAAGTHSGTAVPRPASEEDLRTGLPPKRRLKAALQPAPAADSGIAQAEAAGLLTRARVEYLELTAAAIAGGRLVSSPLNPRGDDRPDEDIDATGVSIVQRGLLQPIQCRVPSFPVGDQALEVIAGETRFQGIVRAVSGIADAQGVTWVLPPDAKFWVGVRVCDDDEAEIIGAIENLRRAPMPPLREAAVFAKARAKLQPVFRDRGFKRVEDAVAEAFGVGPRTVFRRLPLLKLAPEVAEAFRTGELTNVQAEAFARGHHNDQRAHLKLIRTGHDWQKSPDQITRAMLKEMIPVERAIFDPAIYQGEIVEDEDGDKFFGDAELFAALQRAAIETRRADLATEWRWVEILENPSYDAFEEHGVRRDDKEAGAVIVVRGLTHVRIAAPVLLKAVADSRRREKAAADRAKGGPAPDTGSARPPLVETQVRALHAAKTRALRCAITGHDTAAIALACLGLLGDQEVRGLQGAVDWQARHGADQYESNTHVASVRARLALAAAAKLPDGRRPAKGSEIPSFERGWNSGKRADSAAWFRALVALPKPELLDLFNHLLVERIGSWAGVNAQASSTWLGDSSLVRAIADITGAGPLLANEWAPDEAYFKGYTVDRLRAIVLALPFYADPLVKHVGKSDPRMMKKGDLVALCLRQPPGTWIPERFAECRFQSETEAAVALAAPPPRPSQAASAPARASRDIVADALAPAADPLGLPVVTHRQS